MEALETKEGTHGGVLMPELIASIDRLLEDPELNSAQRKILLEEREDVALSHVMVSILDGQSRT